MTGRGVKTARAAARSSPAKRTSSDPPTRRGGSARGSGAPRRRAAREACALRSVGRIHLSLTHDAGIAVAGVVLEASGRRS